MPTITLPIEVEFENEDPIQVIVDQRDIAAFEVQPFGCPFSEISQRPFTAYRWMAWHALRRTKRIKESWEVFKDRCVEARDNRPEESEADSAVDVVDPGMRAQ